MFWIEEDVIFRLKEKLQQLREIILSFALLLFPIVLITSIRIEISRLNFRQKFFVENRYVFVTSILFLFPIVNHRYNIIQCPYIWCWSSTNVY